MTTSQIFIVASSFFLALVGFVHSFFGEKFLLKPMLKARGNKVLENELGRFVLRFGWHVATATWWLLAVVVYSLADVHLNTINVLTYGTIITFIGLGVYDLIASKAKHIGWPILLLIGVCLLVATLLQ